MAQNGNKYKLLANQPAHKELENTSPTKLENITFSFENFRQLDYLGIKECDNTWFTGLLIRLSEISKLTLQELRNIQKQNENTFRYHPVNWEQKNIPIVRDDINWVSNVIIRNSDEYEFYQLSISQSSGRFIGFWGNQEVHPIFYIVLLDPKHNIQPSKKHNYQVRTTYEAISQYDTLKMHVSNALANNSCKQECNLIKELELINRKNVILSMLI